MRSTRKGAFVLEHLVHEPMLDVGASGVGAIQITDQLLEGRRVLERVSGQHVERLSWALGFKPALASFRASLMACLA